MMEQLGLQNKDVLEQEWVEESILFQDVEMIDYDPEYISYYTIYYKCNI